MGEDGDIHYLVMEYVEGQTLKEFIISNGPLTPEQALPIMQQLVSAISNAHYNGIVHRDIKPQNILMDHDGNVKITDFGIAMALSATAHTKTNSVFGTVHYLSPEQARGGMATKKSDIYSLGIVFYELLTGEITIFRRIGSFHRFETFTRRNAFCPRVISFNSTKCRKYNFKSNC